MRCATGDPAGRKADGGRDSALVAMVASGDVQRAEYERMTIPTGTGPTVGFVEPFESGEFEGRLEVLRHAARWLPDRCFEAYERAGDLDPFVRSVAGFFRAAFEESLGRRSTAATSAKRRRMGWTPKAAVELICRTAARLHPFGGPG
jgi:hypothetical protein